MIKDKESTTAKICSLCRAFHSLDEANIFNDYLAFDLIGKNQISNLKNTVVNCMMNDKFFQKDINDCISKWLRHYFSPVILPRSTFAEKRLNLFAKKYEKSQYVILGAGLDTFSFRNKNQNITVFEIDHPNTQLYKKNRLNELNWEIPQNVNFISVDFESENIIKLLENKDFDINLPTFFTILGVTYYISYEVLQNMIKTISELTNTDKEIVMDFPDETTFMTGKNERAKALFEITRLMGEKMQGNFSIFEIQNILKSNKFKISKYMNPCEIQHKFFKENKDTQKAYENIHFIAARQTKDSVKRRR